MRALLSGRILIIYYLGVTIGCQPGWLNPKVFSLETWDPMGLWDAQATPTNHHRPIIHIVKTTVMQACLECWK